MKKALTLLLLAGVSSLLSGCYTNPVTGRKSLVLLTQGDEAKLGAESFQAIRQKEKVSRIPPPMPECSASDVASLRRSAMRCRAPSGSLWFSIPRS